MDQDVLLETLRLATNNYTTEAYALASLYKDLPIDLVLGELDPSWYEESRTTLEKPPELSSKVSRRYWKSPQRQRLFAEAQSKCTERPFRQCLKAARRQNTLALKTTTPPLR